MMFNLVAKTRGETCALAFLSFLLFLFSMPPSARATQSVTLAWDPSPGSDIAGYNIYYGVASSSYTSKVSVGNVTNATVAGLVEGTTYYFAATALNTSGLESDPSNEVVYSVPAAPPGSTNQPPTLNIIPSVAINENAPEQSVNLSGISSGSANEVQTLTVTASSSNLGLIPNPAVTYTSPNTTGTLKFTPLAYAYGTATITVQVNDGQPSNNIVTCTFAVTVAPVNQAPTLNAISAVSITENATEQTVTLSGIGSGAPNESQPLSVTASSSNPALIPNPTVIYASPNTTGTLKFTPLAYAYGSATITVQVNDGQPSNNIVTRTFAVTVAPVNQPPTLNAISAVSVNENAPEQSVALSGISSGASNETQPLTVTASSSNPALIPNPAVLYTSPAATGTLRFTPVMYAYGTATITVQVNDGQPSNNIVTRTFAVTVALVNQAPTLNPIADLTINQNSPEQIVALSGISSGAINETQALTVTASSSNPALIPNPTIVYASPNTAGTLKFTPVAGTYGNATLTVQVNDGGAANNTVTRTFTVAVVPVNRPPTLNTIADMTLEESASPQTVTLSGISAGATNEVQNLTVTAHSSNPGLIPNPTVSYLSPNTTGTLTIAPVTFGYGTATITVQVNDGQSIDNLVTRTFVVTVAPVNQPPTLAAISDLMLPVSVTSQTVTLTGISSGATNESQSLVVSATSSNPSLIPNPPVAYVSPNATASLTLTPMNKATGTATITVTVSDGQPVNGTISRSFTVAVVDGNQAPTLDPLPNLVLQKSSSVQRVNLSGITSGAPFETQTLLVTAISSDTALIPNPTVSYLSPNTTGTITFRPATARTGTATISVTVNDGQASNNTLTRTFTVNVVDVLAPQITKAPTQQAVIGPGPFTLSAEAIGTSPTYQWLKDGAAIPGATALSLTVTQSSRTHSGLYSITVSNSAGMVSSSNAEVRVMMPQKVSDPEVQPDGSIVITSADFDGGVLGSGDIAHFELQASDDSVNWVPVASSALLTDGFLVFRDPNPAVAPVRYYRVVENP